MSKLDAQRAMREAKYERDRTAAGKRPAARTPRSDVPVAPPLPPAETSDLCGHASISGRTCTRPAGHPQKSHRYS